MSADKVHSLLADCRRDIVELVRSGVVPRTCASFTELHDYCDANCLGEVCEDEVWDGLVKHFGGRDPHDEGIPQEMMDLLNQTQSTLDLWIRSGALKDIK